MRKALYFHFTQEDTKSQKVKWIVQGHRLYSQAQFLPQEEYLKYNVLSLKPGVLNSGPQVKIESSMYM